VIRTRTSSVVKYCQAQC